MTTPRHSPETIEKIRRSNIGKFRTPETRDRLRLAALKRAPKSADERERISVALTGRKLSAEHRAKLSAAANGRTYSAETRAKMSASAKAFVARTGRHNMTPAVTALGHEAQASTHEKKCLTRFLRQCMHRTTKRDSGKLKAIEITAILGYTADDLRRHLEARFVEGMSWDTYGQHGWHIDHVRPVASFLKAGIHDPRVVNALDNLQPLWASVNHRKAAKHEAA